MAWGNARKSGVAFFVGVVQFGFFMIIAESFYPGYVVSQNYISDLGATCTSTCQFVQPSSTIFNTSIVVGGLLVIVGSYYFGRAFRTRLLPVFGTISGIGMVGVGTFTEATGIYHSLFSLLTFVSIGITAIVAYRGQKPPLSYFGVIAGVVTLLALVLYVGKIYLGLGPGGMERVVVYPVLFWAIGFGGHLIATEDPLPS